MSDDIVTKEELEDAAAAAFPVGMEVDEARWENQVAPIREALDALLLEHYGERCEAFEPECVLCAVWKHRDEVLDNPYNDEPASPDLPLEVYDED